MIGKIIEWSAISAFIKVAICTQYKRAMQRCRNEISLSRQIILILLSNKIFYFLLSLLFIDFNHAAGYFISICRISFEINTTVFNHFKWHVIMFCCVRLK